jgi:hypothetical protein
MTLQTLAAYPVAQRPPDQYRLELERFDGTPEARLRLYQGCRKTNASYLIPNGGTMPEITNKEDWKRSQVFLNS